jgi:DNA recombination protein RmuC
VLDPISMLPIIFASISLILLLVLYLKHLSTAGVMSSVRQDVVAIRKEFSDNLEQARDENAKRSKDQREELARSLSGGFTQVGQLVTSIATSMRESFEHLSTAQKERLELTIQRVNQFGENNATNFAAMETQSTLSRKLLREETSKSFHEFGQVLAQRLDQSAESQRERLENVGTEIRRHAQLSYDTHEKLRESVESRLDHLRQENSMKLDEMRVTVDEKLQGTLEKRLGESFQRVDEQLKMVHESVGKMQDLAVGVGDLKRLFGNVKLRGGWAEVSLGSLLEQVFTAEQYETNVAVDPNSEERVEFAIKLPGQGSEDNPCWLPIDAKFPVEDYERLLQASERGDAEAEEAALKGLEVRIKREGATICKKYVKPPHTTDFGIMFLPTEGLYAEVIRRPGLVDFLQRDCQIIVAGPTVLMAILSSLRMGFKTLAIQKKSSEVWKLLGSVKAEFSNYGQVLDKVKRKLDDASATLEKDVMVRTRAVTRALRTVELLPEHEVKDALMASIPALATGAALSDDSEDIRE